MRGGGKNNVIAEFIENLNNNQIKEQENGNV
jgi:hypothetical protein